MQVNYAYNYTYNGAGRVLTQTMSVGASSGSKNTQLVNFAAAYQWDTEGRMTSMQCPSVTTAAYASWVNPTTTTLPTAAYQYDVNGRMAGMTWDSGSGPQPYANASYNPAGQLLTLGYGAGTETRTYNSMLQLISQSVPGLMNMTYSYSSSQNNGRITSAADGMTGETTNYTYDSLNRLTAASNSLWNQSYGYDGFGNLTSKSQANGSPNASPSMSISYDANNHQVGASYDANGNLSAANGWSNGYSTDNRLNNQNSNAWPYASAMFGYDPWGKRVMKRTDPDPQSLNTGSNPTWDFDFNGITGQRLVSVSCTDEGIGAPWGIPWPNCNVIGQNVHFGKKLLVSNGVNVVTDRLGTVRANTQGESFAYYPYGEERTSTVNGREKFGTYFRDWVGQDYADQRFHNVGMGRFFTVDRGGANPGNPASWNRYGYGQGDPINLRDPHGMEVASSDEGCVAVGDDGNGGTMYNCNVTFTDDVASEGDGGEVTVIEGTTTDSEGEDFSFDPGFGPADFTPPVDSQQKPKKKKPPIPLPSEICNQDVIAAMVTAWEQASNGTTGVEAGFDLNGTPSNYSIVAIPSSNQSMALKMPITPGSTFDLFHVHPNRGDPKPSPNDISIANANNIDMFTITSRGLYEYNPSNKTTVLLRGGLDWTKPCPKNN